MAGSSLFKGLRRPPRAFFLSLQARPFPPNPGSEPTLRSPSWLVEAEIGGDAVDLVHEPLARLVVIDLIDLGGPLVAVDPIDHFEERRDRLHSPSATATLAICIACVSLANCSLA